MKMRIVRKQGGQTLVTVALALLALFAFLALAVDAGHFYAERRRMQNAADAGALAGARSLCAQDGTDPYVEAENYAVENGAWVDKTSVEITGGTVTVTAVEESEPFFAQIVGLSTVDIQAEAAAACGKAVSACGLWPITLDGQTWIDHQDCGTQFLLWEDGKANCDDWNCDIDCDDVPEDLPLDSRAWADFSAVLVYGKEDPCDKSGCGADELKDRLIGENNGEPCISWVEVPNCMAGKSGVVNSAWVKAGEQVGKIVRFPLYDATGCTMEHDPGNACSNERYHIFGFGCVRVLGSYHLCPSGDVCAQECTKNNGPRVLLVVIPCDADGELDPACFTDCGTTEGDPAGPGDIIAVSLIK